VKSSNLQIYENTKKSIEYFWNDIKRDDSNLKNMSFLPISDDTTSNDNSNELRNLYEIKKSSFILMLYNIIEATVTKLIQEIIEVIVEYSSKTEYRDVNENIRSLWIKLLIRRFGGFNDETKVKRIDSLCASFSEPDKKGQLFKDYGDIGGIINVSEASGNLDFRKIKQIFGSFGIEITPSQSQENQSEEILFPKFSELKDIKELRNQLAHGSRSFLEGFANKGVGKLKKYMDETFECLEILIRETDKYCDELRMNPGKEILSSNI